MRSFLHPNCYITKACLPRQRLLTMMDVLLISEAAILPNGGFQCLLPSVSK
jgi:hypothetical protein